VCGSGWGVNAQKTTRLLDFFSLFFVVVQKNGRRE